MRFSKKTGFFIFLACLAILLISLFWIVSTHAEDPGEPIPTLDPVAQIRWKGDAEWTDITATDITYSADPLGTHSWLVFGTGNVLVRPWECMLGEGRKASFAVATDIDVPAGAILFVTFYEIRVWALAYEGTPQEQRSVTPSVPGKLYVAIWSGVFGPVHPGG